MSRKLVATLSLRIINHAKQQASAKGFALKDIERTFIDPARVIPSRTYPGQIRVCGNGLCLVGRPEGSHFVLITVYADRILTPPRPDQLKTEKGREYATWYNNRIAPICTKKPLEVIIDGVKQNIDKENRFS